MFSGNDSFTVGEPRRCYESYTFDKYTGIVTGVTPCYPYGEEYEGRTVYGLGSVSYLDIDWASSVCSRWGWNPHDARAATVEEDEPEYSKAPPLTVTSHRPTLGPTPTTTTLVPTGTS